MFEGVLSLVTPPPSEPVGLDEVKAHLREIGTDKDGLIIGRLIAAVKHVEAYTGRALITQSWDWWLPCFPARVLKVPKPPLQAVSAVKYVDAAGAEQTFDAANYAVVAPAGPMAPAGWLELGEDAAWPDHAARRDAVRIRFVAGWTGPENVPDGIRSAIKLIVMHLNEHLGDRQEAGVRNSEPRQLPPAAEALLDPYRVF